MWGRKIETSANIHVPKNMYTCPVQHGSEWALRRRWQCSMVQFVLCCPCCEECITYTMSYHIIPYHITISPRDVPKMDKTFEESVEPTHHIPKLVTGPIFPNMDFKMDPKMASSKQARFGSNSMLVQEVVRLRMRPGLCRAVSLDGARMSGRGGLWFRVQTRLGPHITHHWVNKAV